MVISSLTKRVCILPNSFSSNRTNEAKENEEGDVEKKDRREEANRNSFRTRSFINKKAQENEGKLG